jgi:hypothetical protein
MRHRPVPSLRRLFLGLSVVGLAVVSAGVGGPNVAGATGQAPEPAAVEVAETPAAHDTTDGHHAELACDGVGSEDANGNYVACTHGPDPAPKGFSIERDVPLQSSNVRAAVSVPCDGDGTSGRRVEVLYVHGSTDRYNQYLQQFIDWSVGMDNIYNASAAETGGQRHLRFVTQGSGTCQPVIRNVKVTDEQLRTFNGSITGVRSAGYNRSDRKYVMFTDSNVYCGIGEFAGDETKSDSNRSNFGPSYGRVDSGCWDASTAAHELGHNLGAVNYGAPNTSNGGHCIDEWDVMCYSDSPDYPAMVTKCADRSHDELLDCNHDDYYSTNPAPGSYLATHFNVADNLYLIKTTTEPPPPPPTPTETTLVNTGSGKCLDLNWGFPDNGNFLQLWDCHDDGQWHANQRFALGADGTIKIAGKCVDVGNNQTANESKVILWTCHGAPNQEWEVRDNGYIVGVQSGKCLTSARAGTANGARAVISDCTDVAAKKWSRPA